MSSAQNNQHAELAHSGETCFEPLTEVQAEAIASAKRLKQEQAWACLSIRRWPVRLNHSWQGRVGHKSRGRLSR